MLSLQTIVICCCPDFLPSSPTLHHPSDPWRMKAQCSAVKVSYSWQISSSSNNRSNCYGGAASQATHHLSSVKLNFNELPLCSSDDFLETSSPLLSPPPNEPQRQHGAQWHGYVAKQLIQEPGTNRNLSLYFICAICFHFKFHSISSAPCTQERNGEREREWLFLSVRK